MSDATLVTVRQRIVDDIIRVTQEWSVPGEVHYGEPGTKLEYQRLPAVWIWDDTEDSGGSSADTHGAIGSGWIEFGSVNVNILVLFEFEESSDPYHPRNINRMGNSLRGALQSVIMEDPLRQGLAITMTPMTKDIHRSTWDALAFLATTWSVSFYNNIKEPWRQDV